MTIIREFSADHECDRCDHPFKFHAGPDRESICMIAEGRVWRGESVKRRPRATKCWCDGYVPKPRSA